MGSSRGPHSIKEALDPWDDSKIRAIGPWHGHLIWNPYMAGSINWRDVLSCGLVVGALEPLIFGNSEILIV